MSRLLACSLLSWLFLMFFCVTASAQTTNATLSGVVEDERGAAVPGVKITIRNSATGFQASAVTNESGAFVIPFLPPAKYTVVAEQTGFKRVQFPDVILNVNDRRSLFIRLEVGEVTSEVIVNPNDASMVNTDPAVATVVDRTFVGNLPLSARSFQSLILLTPGVVLTPATGSGMGQFSVNGQRTNANYFTVDGVSANSSITDGGSPQANSQQLAGSLPSQTALGSTQSILSVDALEEFKIQTSTYSAEFGRQPGAQVQFTSRAGTNDFHGSLFDYVRNEAFDANDWFTNAEPLTAQQIAEGVTKQPRAPLRQNQYGGTLGGPISFPRFGDGGPGWYSGKDRTFFFLSYEGMRALQPFTGRNLVPSLRLRDLAAPSVRPILNAFPIPTEPEIFVDEQPSGFAQFVTRQSSPMAIDATSLRIDHAFNSKITVFGRYGDTPSESLIRTLSLLGGTKNMKRDITLASTQVFNSTLTNEIRFNYTKSRGRFTREMDDFGGAVPIDPSLLVSGYDGPGTKNGSVNIFLPPSFLGSILRLGSDTDSHQEQVNFVDNFSFGFDGHRLKFGFDYRRLAPVYGPREYTQETSFNSVEALTTGVASDIRISRGQGARPRYNNYSFYVDDTWNASKRLTLNLGLRWEINPPPYDANGVKPTLVCGVENLPTASLCPTDTPLRKTDYTAFAPRFGAAYLINRAAARETVIRGGFGVFYDLGTSADAIGFSGFPFIGFKSFENVPFPLNPEQAQPPPFFTVTLPVLDTVTATNPDLKLPVTYQWNFGIEQSLGANQTLSVFYVASAGRGLLATRDLNNRPINPITGVRGPRANPNFRSINYTSNGPTSDYHSMQVRFQRRFSKGLQALANYTWSHAIDEVSSEFDQTLEKGNAAFDVRHNFSAGVTYDLPKIESGRFFNSILRGWSLDALLFMHSGAPINVVDGNFTALEDGASISVRPDLVPAEPLWVDDPAAPGGRKLNVDAFALVPRVLGFIPLRQGTLGRNAIPGPNVYQTNMALRRQFGFSERWKLQLKAEVFNIFNRPHFGEFFNLRSFAGSFFGKAQGTLNVTLGGLAGLYQVGGPRSFQFSARLSF